MQRYFAKDKNLTLLDSDIYHIKKVMRMNINEEIEVIYSKKRYLCKITNLDNFSFDIIKENDEDNELDIELIIAIGLVKEQKFDLIIQKLTELGVSKIIPLEMERSIVKLDNKKEEKKLIRWNLIAKEASEQSKRSTVLEVTKTMKLKELVNIESDLKFVCSVENNNLLNNYLQNKDKCAKMIIVIGPEGGITSKEEEYLNNNNYTSVSLGSRVLRVETATIYIACVLNYLNMR